MTAAATARSAAAISTAKMMRRRFLIFCILFFSALFIRVSPDNISKTEIYSIAFFPHSVKALTFFAESDRIPLNKTVQVNLFHGTGKLEDICFIWTGLPLSLQKS